MKNQTTNKTEEKVSAEQYNQVKGILDNNPNRIYADNFRRAEILGAKRRRRKAKKIAKREFIACAISTFFICSFMSLLFANMFIYLDETIWNFTDSMFFSALIVVLFAVWIVGGSLSAYVINTIKGIHRGINKR